ncbi:hypothetical protein ATCC90586_006734 [Pythium insidiosum]|nr:hypothetical protein ATCC90586_006734 [Pythium insidiosum]
MRSGKVRRPARVERRGRFTITEIDPDSPSALPGPVGAFSDTDGDHDGAESEGRASFVHESAAAAFFVASSGRHSIGGGEPSPAETMERQDSFMGSESAGSVVLAASEASPNADSIDRNGTTVQQEQQQQQLVQQHADAISPQMNDKTDAPVDAAAVQPDRRVKRKGRFTIIELSSRDSPRSRRNSDEKAITISADQFLQQQQTIASLIRQQHDLKQLIGVLQEQQQYLVSIPMQLNELKLEQAQTYVWLSRSESAEKASLTFCRVVPGALLHDSNAQEETMREMHMQVEALTRANEGLQSLLSQAEHDANERTMEIEYLLEENHQLRQRCGHFERKYGEERQISFALEQELQQIHMSRQRRKSEPAQRQAAPPSTEKQHQPASESAAAAEN